MPDTIKVIKTDEHTKPVLRKKVHRFLNDRVVGVLATVDANNNPHAATIYYSVDQDLNIFFTTKIDTSKHQNITLNNHVVLVVNEAYTQSAVQVHGIAHEVTNDSVGQEKFKKTVFAASQTSRTGVPPITKLPAGKYITYCIKPLRIQMVEFIHTEPGGNDIYETLDFEP